MDEIEQRLIDALAIEAASVTPRASARTGKPGRSPRRNSTTLMAAAAVVAIIVGIGLAVRGTSTPVSTPAGPGKANCDAAWSAYGGRVIEKSGSSVSTGPSAVTYFAHGAPPRASLCALTIGADNRTTAFGGTVSDGSSLGYLTSMRGDKTYLIGAFADPVQAVSFSDRSLRWTLTIDANTSGLTDLGNGWFGYVVLAPAGAAEVSVHGIAKGGASIDQKQLNLGHAAGPTSRSTASARRVCAQQPQSTAACTLTGVMKRIDTAERRRRLQSRHLLTPDRRSSDLAAVADAVLALHATDPATVYLSAWARMTTGSQLDMADAIYGQKRLVRMMGMRRTMFVVADHLAPVVHASSSLGVAATQRKRLLTELRQAGVADDTGAWLDDVCESTVAALDRRGSSVANALVADEPRLATILDLAPDKAYAAPQKVTSRVLTILALQGRIVRGAPLGGWTSNRNEWWPAAAWMPGGLGDLDPDAARVDLARRWLKTFGPAPITDLVWWTGWTLGQVRTALKSIATIDVDLEGTTGLVLADDLDETPESESTAVLLPALDPTPMGWVERSWFLGEHRERLFDRTGNIGPTIFWQGRVVGGWAQHADGEIRLGLLEDIGSDGRAAVEARSQELTTWLGSLRFIPRFRTPLEKELVGVQL